MRCEKALKSILLVCLVWISSCSSEDPLPVAGPGGPLVQSDNICKVQEIELRNAADEIAEIREFVYDVKRNNRLESITIVEGLDTDPLTFRFQFYYAEETAVVPKSVEEILGGEVQSSIDFRFSADGNLTEFIQYQVSSPNEPPQSHLFFYETSELAQDSINTRIIVFDIDRFTSNWIDVLPAVFTSGGQRISRFERISFRGDLLEFCDFTYNEQGFLENITCRRVFGTLSEIWDFTYQQGRLTSALHQLPEFWSVTDYEYDDQGKPLRATSTTGQFLNWSGRYFYLCN